MGFLDNTGLVHYTDKLKETFVRSVNGEGPDAGTGNVEIINVATADNLTSEDAVESYDSFIYRTSGGLTNIDSGEATLMYIDGGSQVTGRVEESLNITTENNINLICTSIVTLRTALGSGGIYNFYYLAPSLPATYISSWNSMGQWQYNGNSIILENYGLSATGVIEKSISISETSETISEVTINPSIFSSEVSTTGTYVFQYIENQDPDTGDMITSWTLQNNEIDSLSDYGVQIVGIPNPNDSITVIYELGTPNSTCQINYQPYVHGTYSFSTPTGFISTGFNQFNKNSSDFYITDATINSETNVIVPSVGSYVCFCKASKDAPWGYMAYSENGYITGIGWASAPPVIGTELDSTIGEHDIGFRNEYNSAITFDQDGYVVVSVTNMEDLCIHTRWDEEEDNVYEDYVEPSIIDFQSLRGTLNGVLETLPISSYGLPAIGNISDRLNLSNKTYIQRITRVPNTSENMDIVVNEGYIFDYTSEFIYYVLDSPNVYLNVEVLVDDTYVPINSKYIVNDFGTEEFTDTDVQLSILCLYGENLRNKLKGDVLTISEQSSLLTSSQLQSIRQNFLDIIYPVGAIYISTTSTSPESLWGGHWEEIHGCFLLATQDSAGWSAGSTGGAATVTLTTNEIPAHTHGYRELIGRMEMRRTASNVNWGAAGASNYGGAGILSWGKNNGVYQSVGGSTTSTKYTNDKVTINASHTHDSVGGGAAHNNMPPYLAVYMWKRTS